MLELPLGTRSSRGPADCAAMGNTSPLYVRWVQELGILGKGFKGRRETLREDGWLVAVPVPVVLVKIDLFLGMCSSGSSPGARATRFSGNIHSRFAPTVSLWRCFTI